MPAATAVAPAMAIDAGHIPGIHSNVDEGKHDDDWEMPLLFMSTMPVNFKQNVDVAAMSTFTAEYEDDDGDSEPKKSPPKAGKTQDKGKHRAQSRKQSNPYARPSTRSSIADLMLDQVKL